MPATRLTVARRSGIIACLRVTIEKGFFLYPQPAPGNHPASSSLRRSYPQGRGSSSRCLWSTVGHGADRPGCGKLRERRAAPRCGGGSRERGDHTERLWKLPVIHSLNDASERRLRAFLEHSLDAVALVSAEGTVLYVSPAAGRILGGAPEAFVGRSALEWVHPDDLDRVSAQFAQLVAAPGGRETAEFRARHEDGSWRWLEAVASNLLAEPDIQAVVLNYRDITENRKVREEREEALRLHRSGEERLLLLAEASNTLLMQTDAARLPSAILDLSRRLFQADAYAIWRRHSETGDWNVIAESNLSAGYPKHIPSTGQQQMELPERPFYFSDVEEAPMLADRREGYRREGVRALLCVPLRLHGELSGTITLYYGQPRSFDEMEIRIAAALADLASSALTMAELYEGQRRMRTEAETARQRLAFLAEASRILSSSLDYETTLDHVARLVVPHLADWCTVHVVDTEGVVRQVAVAHADPDKVKWARALQDRYPYDPDQPRGLPNVLRTGETELYPEITDAMLEQSARDPDHLAILREVGFTGCIIVPLRARRRVLGAITFIAAESGYRYQAADVRLAEDLATRAATAIDNARLYSRSQTALAALTRSEARFRRLVESNLIGIHSGDLQGLILDANDAFLRMVGYSREELLSGEVRWDTLTAPEYRRLDEQAVAALRQQGACPPYEKELVRKDGSRIPVLIGAVRFEGPTEEGIAFILDLTERKRAEGDIRYMMEHARCLLWHAVAEAPLGPHQPYRWDFQIFDEQAAQRFLPLELLPGETYPDAFYRCRPLEDRRQCDRTARAALETGATHYAQEYRCFRQDGELRWLSEEAYLEPEGPGRWRVAGVCTDITERKLLEEALRERAQELTEADRRKDDFLAMLAHELRNPLGAIANSANVLERGAGDESMRRRALSVLQRQVQHQARLVDDLLDVSRITRGLVEIRREPLELVRLVRETTEDYRPAFDQHGILLDLQAPDAPLWVSGDPTRLAQVLGNLLSNALKFCHAGSRVTVQVSSEPDGFAAFSVRDTGIGIPERLLPHVFESFIQGERSLARSRGGLGLGLALVKGLVELHGGEAQASSGGPGQGAEFRVRLPALARLAYATAVNDGNDQPPAPAPLAAGAVDPVSRVRVLVVEDNEDAADTLRDLLELFGYQVEVALNGPLGVDAARRFAPDVVLCDIGLPGMDGYSVAAELRKHPSTAGARIFAVSGYGQDADRRRSAEAGFDLHLTKPIDPDELRRLLGPADTSAERPANGR